MSGSQHNSLIDSLEDSSHMQDSIKIDQLRYENTGFGHAYPEDDHHTEFLDDFKNKSRYPEDFVSQFSPVEEEPVINQKVLDDFESESNDHEKHLLNQQKHIYTTSSIISSSHHESSTTNAHPAGHVHSPTVHKTTAAEFEPEEFTYTRSGPLLVGNPVILKPEPDTLTEVKDKGPSAPQYDYDWSTPSPKQRTAVDSSSVTAAAKAQASNIMQDFDPFFATGGGPPGAGVGAGSGAAGVVIEPAKKPVTASKPDDSINKTTSFVPKTTTSSAATKFTPSTTSTDKFFNLKRLNPKFLDLIYWRDPKKSALFFVPVFVLLLCLALFSFISVFAYAGLILIAISLSLRLYTIVLSYFGKKPAVEPIGEEKLDEKAGGKNPLEPYLKTSLKLNEEEVHRQVDGALKQWNSSVEKFRSLVLSENFFDTAKLAVVLWFLTYVGACISFTALIIIAFVALFTLPKFYEVYQQPIDRYYALVESKVKHVLAMVNEKIAQITKKKPHVE